MQSRLRGCTSRLRGRNKDFLDRKKSSPSLCYTPSACIATCASSSVNAYPQLPPCTISLYCTYFIQGEPFLQLCKPFQVWELLTILFHVDIGQSQLTLSAQQQHWVKNIFLVTKQIRGLKVFYIDPGTP